MTEVVVDPGFQSVVRNHLVGNLVVSETLSPLILGIFGPPGEGKTFQTQQICEQLGVESLPVSSSELESENAAHPVQLLRREYLRASNSIAAGTPSVLVIDDIDTAIGDWGSMVQYTVNRQLVIGQLMAFCDFPEHVAGHTTRRVPIVVTGNRPDLLYGPLTRPGRMRTMVWQPSTSTRLPIVRQLFSELASDDVVRLVRAFPERSIAFWSDVRTSMWDTRISGWVSAQPNGEIARLLKADEQIRLPPLEMALAEIFRVASALDESLLDKAAHTFGSS